MTLPIPTAQPGFWPSSFTAEHALQGMKEYGQLIAGPDHRLYWVEYQPENNGRTAICRWQDGVTDVLTPEPMTIRSRVHEYGGQSWCLLDQQLAFVNGDDQQIWLQTLDDLTIQKLTDTPACRYGAPVWDASRHRLIAVQEEHFPGDNAVDVVSRLVAVDVRSGMVTVLHQGYDFYDQAVISDSPVSGQIAWISWNHPHQPWTETELLYSPLDEWGGLSDPQVLVSGEQALTQPQFDAQGRLHVISDHDNWWQIYRVIQRTSATELQPLAGQSEAEYAAASWQLGQCSYQLLNRADDSDWVALSHRDGMGYLQHYRAGHHQLLATEYSCFRSLTLSGNTLFCVAASTTCNSALIAIQLDHGDVQVITGGEPMLSGRDIAEPQHLTFPVNAAYAHALFYPPANAAEVLGDALPPLVVFLHGGPTSAAYPMFSPKLQYWTQRGFAVADLNYRGSTGYGRDYRMQLGKQWGMTDVEDAVALVAYLTAQQQINPQQVFIRGGSAGGYTALAALAASDCFAAGASLYGVSDLQALCASTHKFESRYLDWLIGDPQQEAHVYVERSPVTNATQVRCPVIFFQGLMDRVVPPEQTDLMVKALRDNGITVEVHRYADEYHGFRDPDVQKEVLELELAFYQRRL